MSDALIIAAIAFASTALNRLLNDALSKRSGIAELRKELQKVGEKIKQAGDEERRKLVEKQIKLSSQLMKEQGKIMLVGIAIFLPLLIFLSQFYGERGIMKVLGFELNWLWCFILFSLLFSTCLSMIKGILKRFQR